MQQNKTCLAPGGQCDCIQQYLHPRVTLTNAGETGFTIIENGLGPNLTVKTLVPGTGINMSYGPTGSLTISAEEVVDETTLTGQGVGPGVNSDLVIAGGGPGLIIKNLNAGTGINFIDNANGPLGIAQDPTYSNVRLSSTGGGTPLVNGVQLGPNLTIKSLLGGGLASLVNTASTVAVTVPDYDPATFFVENTSGTGGTGATGATGIPNGATVKFLLGNNLPIVSWGTHIVTPGNENGVQFTTSGSYLINLNIQTSPNVATVIFGHNSVNTLGLGPGSQITMNFVTQFGFGTTGYVGLTPTNYMDMTLVTNVTAGESRYFYIGVLTTDGLRGDISAGGLWIKRLH